MTGFKSTEQVYQALQAHLSEIIWRIGHPIKYLEQQPAYWRFRSQIKQSLKQIWLAPARTLQRRPALLTPSNSLASTVIPLRETQTQDDSYTSLTLVPPPSLTELRDKLKEAPALIPCPSWENHSPKLSGEPTAGMPRVSLIVITYNNLELTQLCLTSLLRNTTYPNYEIIVIDNHSTDDTPTYLSYLANYYPHLTFILNSKNRGFAYANNQGLARATGEYLVLLNNDTIVPPGWLNRLVSHLVDPTIGIVGPVTNFAGNEAQINVPYKTWGGMEAFAWERAQAYAGQLADIQMLAMYCLAMRREVYTTIGPLDEQFGIGMFEDDDYAQRVRAEDYRVVCALDVFIHHVGQAAFGKLIPSGEYDRLFSKNLRRYEAKWKVRWTPHRHGLLHLGKDSISRASSPPAKD